MMSEEQMEQQLYEFFGRPMHEIFQTPELSECLRGVEWIYGTLLTEDDKQLLRDRCETPAQVDEVLREIMDGILARRSNRGF